MARPKTPSSAPDPVIAQVEAIKAVAPKLAKYYRIEKITGFLHQILEVEVDESQIAPVRVGKQDLKQIIQDRIVDYVAPHPDGAAFRERQKNRK